MRPLFLLRLVLLATALVLSDVLTIERMSTCPDEQLPTLIGMPLVHRTSIPWVNSMSGVLFLQGLLVNIACWSVVLAGLGLGLKRITSTAPQAQRVLRVSSVVLTVLAAGFSLLFIGFIEWRVEWSPDILLSCPERAVRFLFTGH
jgi:hypothetical protein